MKRKEAVENATERRMRKAGQGTQGRTKHGDRGWHGMWDDKMSGRVSTVNIACLLGENSSYTRYRVLLEGVTTTMLTMYTVKYDSRESLQVVFSPTKYY